MATYDSSRNGTISHGAQDTLHGSWSPQSWRIKEQQMKQPTIYPQEVQPALDQATARLQKVPPLVTPTEIVKLKASLKDVAQGKAFLLQGGDCAELFDYCEQNPIESKIKLLLQMSMVLIWGANKPVVRIGRMAGQYAKPRSSPTEMVDGKEIPSFRGDILNGFSRDSRDLDPARLLEAYFYSASTLNYIRGALASGFADLHGPLDWSLGHVKDQDLSSKYSRIVTSITESLRFMRTVGADTAGQLQTVDFFTSHEALVLQYEEPLTRKLRQPNNTPALAEAHGLAIQKDHPAYSQITSSWKVPAAHNPSGTAYYNTSAHFLWVGDRTRNVNGAHVEFLRGIQNPIGIKVGPTTSTSDLLELLRTINPAREVGKITLITRYGASKVRALLPTHIRAVEDSEYARCCVWQCDPMHGNGKTTKEGIKTRHFQDIFDELLETLTIHKTEGSYLGGVHLELTGDPVTECVGGSEGLAEEDLNLNYTSYCDPRLNEKQALELAFLIANHYRAQEE
ncbi:phospho-2-dehydro-3-deoxyheptonate aldolase-1 [Coleophoma cylindrospora]|uniref:Phospho-2-dehydro-3-deoxyheptonate aldolase n=1 Tax=Coleophoma cylindrospora TaxID=1849047 RepID=A0A3D8STT2_9HELO|nr:phospho-2-dehydro-3-deoxyheptonate aldolase-1 [Coleophoma cylindrospora]